MKVPNNQPDLMLALISLSRLQNEGSQQRIDDKRGLGKSIKATE